MPFLRLLFEATDAIGKRPATLWRGIAADLYEEYAPGSLVTWWSVSSCTADEEVVLSSSGAAVVVAVISCQRLQDSFVRASRVVQK